MAEMDPHCASTSANFSNLSPVAGYVTFEAELGAAGPLSGSGPQSPRSQGLTGAAWDSDSESRTHWHSQFDWCH